MPYLQFEFNRPLSGTGRERLVDWTTREYADVMETGTDHVAVSIREQSEQALALGRATSGDPVAVVNADIRTGRTLDQRERFAEGVIEMLDDGFDVPPNHCYVVYTEHDGQDFFLEEGALESWSRDESD